MFVLLAEEDLRVRRELSNAFLADESVVLATVATAQLALCRMAVAAPDILVLGRTTDMSSEERRRRIEATRQGLAIVHIHPDRTPLLLEGRRSLQRAAEEGRFAARLVARVKAMALGAPLALTG